MAWGFSEGWPGRTTETIAIRPSPEDGSALVRQNVDSFTKLLV